MQVLYSSRRSAFDDDSDGVKSSLSKIITTFQQEREEFERAYQKKEESYKDKIEQQKQIIEELRNHLNTRNEELDKAQRQIDSYQANIKELKIEFKKMNKFVGEVENASGAPSLTKVKSQVEVGLLKKQASYPRLQVSEKFDINAYFLNARFHQAKKVDFSGSTMQGSLFSEPKSKGGPAHLSSMGFRMKQNSWGQSTGDTWTSSRREHGQIKAGGLSSR